MENLLKKYGLGNEYQKQVGLRKTAAVCKEGFNVYKPKCSICAARKYCELR
jgi:hypothetical protein